MKNLLFIALTLISCNKVSTFDSNNSPKIVLSTLYWVDDNDIEFVTLENYIEIGHGNTLRGIQKNDENTKTINYTLSLSNDLISKINSLIVNEEVFQTGEWELSPPYINYCGPTYKLEVINGTIRKFALFDPTRSNSTQGEIMTLFDKIILSEPKQSIAPFNIDSYISNSTSELRAYWTYPDNK